MIQDKQKDESYVAFAKRVTDAYENRLIDIDEWGEMILGENIYSSETTRRCNMFMRRFLELCEVDEALRKQDKTPEELDLMALKENIQEERLKLQTVNLEYNQIQRAKARDKLFTEQIVDAIKRLPALEPIENGELKTNKCDAFGNPKETVFITQISGIIDELIEERPFENTHLYEKIKNIYVGIETQVPVYGKKQITFSSENINEFFTVQNNSAYPFEINPSTTNQVGFVPGNIGINSSTSQIMLTANQEIVLKKIYAQYYTERNYDKINITINAVTILGDASGEDTYESTANRMLSAGDKIVMSYVKDSSNHHSSEAMTKIIIECEPITVDTIMGYETKPVARRIKKVYVGVNGKARLCYSGDEGYSKLKKDSSVQVQRST